MYWRDRINSETPLFCQTNPYHALPILTRKFINYCDFLGYLSKKIDLKKIELTIYLIANYNKIIDCFILSLPLFNFFRFVTSLHIFCYNFNHSFNCRVTIFK